MHLTINWFLFLVSPTNACAFSREPTDRHCHQHSASPARSCRKGYSSKGGFRKHCHSNKECTRNCISKTTLLNQSPSVVLFLRETFRQIKLQWLNWDRNRNNPHSNSILRFGIELLDSCLTILSWSSSWSLTKCNKSVLTTTIEQRPINNELLKFSRSNWRAWQRNIELHIDNSLNWGMKCHHALSSRNYQFRLVSYSLDIENRSSGDELMMSYQLEVVRLVGNEKENGGKKKRKSPSNERDKS